MLTRLQQALEIRIAKTTNWFSSVYRLATSPLRSFPDLIIVGAMKSGTSSLFWYLTQHPKITTGNIKEVHFFDNNYSKGPFWYRSHFPVSDGSIICEGSPYYLNYPHAAKRIHELIPSAKMIAILRNPTERAISHYYHQVRKERETLPILEAFQAEEERVKAEWERMLEDETYISPTHQYFSYKHRGIYIDQLERYWQYFDDSNLLVLNAARLFSEPTDTLKELYEFVGVDAYIGHIDLTPQHASSNKAKVPSSVHEYLDDFFAPYNQRLYQRLGRDFGW